MGVNNPGLNIFEGLPPDPSKGIGRVFWVNNSTTPVPGGVAGVDAAGSAGDAKHPFATIDYGFSETTASRDDVLYVGAGHSETYATAADLALDIAGVKIIGLGNGRLRPNILVSDSAATIAVTAANITIENFFFDLTGVDALTQLFDVGAADFVLKDCEFLMADSGGQATECIVTDSSSHRMKIINCTFRSTNAGANNAISIEGTPDGIEIVGCHIYGDFADACIHNPTGNVATNLKIHDNYLQNDQNGDHALELVSACTGEVRGNHFVTDAIATAATLGATMNADNWYSDDGATDAAAVPFPETVTTGGSTISQVADRLGTEADTDPVSEILSGTGGITTWKTGAAPATGVSMSEVIRYASENLGAVDATAATGAVTATDNVMAYVKQLITQNGIELDTNTLGAILYGTGGIATFPTAAAAANAVSIAEVLRYISEYQVPRITSKAIAAWASSFTTGLSPVTLFTVTGNVKARVYMVQTTAATSTGTNGTIAIGVTGNTGGFMAAVAANGTNFPTNAVWAGDTSPTLLGEILSAGALDWVLIGNGADIIATIATNDMTAGASTFYCEYIPLDSSSTVVAA